MDRLAWGGGHWAHTSVLPLWAPASRGEGLAERPWVAVPLEVIPSVAAGPPGAGSGGYTFETGQSGRGQSGEAL